ncbi:allergen Tha p 1-like [Vanessa cardui]|uniref:allergen Tha p 1-like n=1 Tax=Vanessa cardui TaxID=171605 RepID=UPI001F13238F|nr:allergen Tha p 1-like [Vanessa cardui]XP_046970569.1 allergen Tha p 1-like [Vanessa cardui]
MKLLFLIAALVPTIMYTHAQNDRFSSVNIEEVLSNKRLLSAYIKCMLDKGRCTPEGKELKSHISDALQTGCENCTDMQKDGVRKVISHLVKKEKEYWNQLVEKYDSEGIYSEKYENELKSLDR